MNEYETQPAVQWWIVRLTFVLLALFVLMCGQAVADSVHDSDVPQTITATVTLESVTCAGPLCAGHGHVFYGGHLYDTGLRGYRTLFNPLHKGQRVTTTLYLGR